ncbi:hypothetical protein Droror1_Dr00017585 [Drosera rotundifolia]
MAAAAVTEADLSGFGHDHGIHGQPLALNQPPLDPLHHHQSPSTAPHSPSIATTQPPVLQNHPVNHHQKHENPAIHDHYPTTHPPFAITNQQSPFKSVNPSHLANHPNHNRSFIAHHSFTRLLTTTPNAAERKEMATESPEAAKEKESSEGKVARQRLGLKVVAKVAGN